MYYRILICFVIVLLGRVSFAADGKLQVYILAGQSNMEGHAKVETFDYIGDDPKTAPLLAEMRNTDGSSKVADHVWISYLTGRGDENGEGFGKLTSGYGSRQNPKEDGGKIGPEFTFGLTMDRRTEDPVLIIKTAWGGKSLYYDFRPPGPGAYQRSEQDIEKDRNPEERSGHYYRLMMKHVQHVLGDISRIVPDYDNAKGYDLRGFVWFQGWNDMVNRNIYPMPPKESPNARFAKYSEWMTQFIGDVRKDLKTPKMPFVIGVMGVGGAKNKKQGPFRIAMAAPASLPEFAGNVRAIETGLFWDEPLAAIQEKREQVRQMGYFLRTEHKNHANKNGDMNKEQQKEYLKKFEADLIPEKERALLARGASNAGYHYLGCAKTFALMGKSYAETLLEMNGQTAVKKVMR